MKYLISALVAIALSLIILFSIGVPSNSLAGLWSFIITYAAGFFMLSVLLVSGVKGLINYSHESESFISVLKRLAHSDFTIQFILSMALWIFFVYDDGLAVYWGHSFRPGAGVASSLPIWAAMAVVFSAGFFLVHAAWAYSKLRGRVIISILFLVFASLITIFMVGPGDYGIFIELGYTNWFWFHLLGAPMLVPMISYWSLIKNKRAQWLMLAFIIINSVVTQVAYNSFNFL